MKKDPPIPMTLHEFRHIHRALLPGESLPRRPTLLEQLQVLRESRLRVAAGEEDTSSESEDGDAEDWPESL